MRYSELQIRLKEPKMATEGLEGLFPIINKYAQISELQHADKIKKFNQAEAELFAHMQMFYISSLLSVSDSQGKIIFANDKFCRTSKYSPDELIGWSHSIVRHPDTPASVFKEMWHTVGNGKVWQGELKNKAKDGSPYWVLATVAPVLGKNGKPIKYINMWVDISKQKLSEKELRETKEKTDIELYENINYARNVHNSFLTPAEELKMVFPESFLIYKALKIISGDFYRIEQLGNQSIIVFGDSTGHGVSASYISIMVLNILTHLMKFGPYTPSEILKSINKEITYITHLNKKHPIRETADTIVCCIDLHSMQMNYVSANIKGVIIRKNKIIELERERCSIGELPEKEFALANHNFPLKKNDCLYLFTDGMTDQIGGAKNKTFRNKQLMEVLAANHLFPINQQKKNIEKIISEWQGNNEQTDDMTLLGIKI